MHNGISLKYKFFIAMSLVTILVSLATAYYGQKLFAEDKIAYVFDHEMNKLSTIDAEFSREVERVKNLSALIFTEYQFGKLSKIGKKLYKQDKGIVGFEVYTNKKADFSLKKEKFPKLKAKKSGVYLLDKKNLNFSLYFPIKDSKSYLRVIFKAEFIRDTLDKSSGTVGLFSYKEISKNKLLKKIRKKFLSHFITQGTFENEKLITFVSVSSSFLIVSQVDKSIALAALYNYFVKIFFVSMLFVGLSMSTAIWVANILTRPLNYLHAATQELGLESTYNKIEVTSNDEIGHLTDMFNIMSDRIVKLLNELRLHNVQLEEMVALRTLELSSALELQKSVMNSLEEGIIVLDNQAKVTNIFSSSAKKMFPDIESEKPLASLLNLNVQEEKTNKKIFKTMYKEMIPFKDIKDLAIKEYFTKDGNSLEFNYSPVRNPAGKIDKIVILSVDKTDIRKAEAEAEQEKKQAKMFVQIMSNQTMFSSAIKDVKNMLTEMEEKVDKNLQDFFHVIHSVKGIVVQFHIEGAADCCHKIEDGIEKRIEENNPPEKSTEFIKESITILKTELREFFKLHGNVVGVQSFDEVKEVKIIELADLISFQSEFLNTASLETQKAFANRFCATPVKEYISAFEDTLYEAARMSNKALNPITITGMEVNLPLRKYDNLFYGIQHLLRNCIEHGIEDTETRDMVGKDPEGTINILTQETDEEYTFNITDDGQGVSGFREASLEQLLEKITGDGFSSSETVGKLSGRGVGMGAVKEIIKSYKGTLELLASSEKGTSFQISIPKS
jgi:signal transduction histidine kinase